MASSEIQRFLEEYPSLKYDKEKQKITCDLTKHEMPATVAAVESYVKGRKFKNAVKKGTYNYEQHKPHIIPSNKKRHLHELFCSLTLRHIARTPEAVERHIKGKRFKRALARWQSCQETGEKFVPRGGQRSHKTTVSDNDSVDGGDDVWMDDSGDEAENDDMSDLYPATDFDASADCEPEDNNDGDSSKHVSTKKSMSTKAKQAIEQDSDSDYDMGIVVESEGNNDGDGGKHVSTKISMSAKAKQTNEQDSDSDYDMSVLVETAKVSVEASKPQQPEPSLATNKRKKKKQRETLPEGGSDAKKK